MRIQTRARRPGATAVEMALVAPVFFLLLFGLLIGGLGIFRYNQVSHLARDAARYACVRGQDYHKDTKLPAATQDSIYENAVKPSAFTLDQSRLTCTVTWDQSNAPRRYSPTGVATTNYVIVTVSYQWIPENWVFPPITLTSTSKMPMSY
ncbi:MAG TPA: TadE/TadG family type IV pilus assembly protein [Gemmataceae bacterium]|nr:TadE/TadG family type IV pilus assembly protein [Gemmataceae bacterium]